MVLNQIGYKFIQGSERRISWYNNGVCRDNRSDWLNVDLMHLSGLIKHLKFSLSNWLLNSQFAGAINGLLPITRCGSRILFFLKEMKEFD